MKENQGISMGLESMLHFATFNSGRDHGGGKNRNKIANKEKKEHLKRKGWNTSKQERTKGIED
jgi:hypothetical protein